MFRTIAILILLAAACSPKSDDAALLIKDVRIVDLGGDAARVEEGMSVLVRDGVIVEVAPSAGLKAPRNAIEVDGAGRMLAPGLTDMHVHVWDEAELGAYVAFGVTTVRNMSGMPFLLTMAEEIEAGRVTGPRLLTTGPILNSDGPNAQINHHLVADDASARKAVNAHYDAGFRHLKVYSNLTREAYEAILDEGRKLGMTITGHTPEGVRSEGVPFEKPFEIAFEEILDDGFVTIEHMESILWHGLYDERDEEKARLLARKIAAAGVAVDPTLIAFHNLYRVAQTRGEHLTRPGTQMLNPAVVETESAVYERWSQDDADRAKRVDDFLKLATKIFHEEGVVLTAGSDAGIFTNIPGRALIDELELLVAAGLSPFEVLKTATVNPAAVLNEADKTGRIAPGYRADLLLVEGDPLADISVLGEPAGVVLNGRWIDAAQLAELKKNAANTNYDRTMANVMDAIAKQQSE